MLHEGSLAPFRRLAPIYRAQPRERSTALFQLSYLVSLVTRSALGWNSASSCQVFAISSVDDHTPSASPARKAAPSPVVSANAGLRTVTPSWSAWNRHSKSITAAPPSTRSSL